MVIIAIIAVIGTPVYALTPSRVVRASRTDHARHHRTRTKHARHAATDQPHTRYP